MFDFMKSRSGKVTPKVEPAKRVGKHRTPDGAKSTMQKNTANHKGRKTQPAFVSRVPQGQTGQPERKKWWQ